MTQGESTTQPQADSSSTCRGPGDISHSEDLLTERIGYFQATSGPLPRRWSSDLHLPTAAFLGQNFTRRFTQLIFYVLDVASAGHVIDVPNVLRPCYC